MKDCDACEIAERFPKTGRFNSFCRQCDARAIAGSPAAWKAAHAVTSVDLQDAIEKVFGIDNYATGRVMVWEWMKRLGVVEVKA